ncbi:hypothetical protein [Oceanobacillus saliphilus]|uniref:hypothetical protein n=1 Tax=Oceanobacillus saliphilus TaxID=2925834 RepID=UPI00201D8DA1|nr:hypothetical protein [Oceanobacillus saliphilus]
MSKDNRDRKIVRLLKKHTDDAAELKEVTWNRIDQELFSSVSDTKTFQRKGRGKGFVIAGLSTAAIIAILIFGFMTDTGQAMIQNLKEMFVEEKEEEIELEGQKEDTNLQLETNEELRYIIYIDEDRYKMVEGETSDRIETKETLGDMYPDVYMEITRVENTTTEEVVAYIRETVENDGDMELVKEEQITEPIESVLVQAIGPAYTNEFGKTGHQWDTPVHRYYITDEYEGQVFVVKQVYFLEAAEGHGARFEYMLESFQVVK